MADLKRSAPLDMTLGSIAVKIVITGIAYRAALKNTNPISTVLGLGFLVAVGGMCFLAGVGGASVQWLPLQFGVAMIGLATHAFLWNRK